MEPLVCRVRVMVLRACLGVDLSKPEWLFMRYFPAARQRAVVVRIRWMAGMVKNKNEKY